MRRFGLRIGEVGVEFSSREERQKALMNFTTGVCIKISDCAGPRYSDHSGAFSTYERDDKEILVNCKSCSNIFGADACPSREYPHKNSWEKEFGTETNHICDACFEAARKAKEIFDAKKVIESIQE